MIFVFQKRKKKSKKEGWGWGGDGEFLCFLPLFFPQGKKIKVVSIKREREKEREKCSVPPSHSVSQRKRGKRENVWVSW